jgi:hypothetical protein
MTSLPAKVIAIEKRGDQSQVLVQIGTKYRGSFNTLAFGEIKPYSGSLKDGRLDLIYYRDPGLEVGDPFPLWILRWGIYIVLVLVLASWGDEVGALLTFAEGTQLIDRLPPAFVSFVQLRLHIDQFREEFQAANLVSCSTSA